MNLYCLLLIKDSLEPFGSSQGRRKSLILSNKFEPQNDNHQSPLNRDSFKILKTLVEQKDYLQEKIN